MCGFALIVVIHLTLISILKLKLLNVIICNYILINYILSGKTFPNSIRIFKFTVVLRNKSKFSQMPTFIFHFFGVDGRGCRSFSWSNTSVNERNILIAVSPLFISNLLGHGLILSVVPGVNTLFDLIFIIHKSGSGKA
jgi:hypothetical protein